MLLVPRSTILVSDPVRRWLERHGVTLHLGAKALGAGETGLEIETADGERSTLPADNILVTVGRKPLTEGWGLEDMALAMDGRFVRVDDRCATSTTNVWAIGDLVGEPMLAHKASAQGEMVAEIVAGRRRRFDPVAIPAVCFTHRGSSSFTTTSWTASRTPLACTRCRSWRCRCQDRRMPYPASEASWMGSWKWASS